MEVVILYISFTFSDKDLESKNEAENREHHELVDEMLLQVLIQLRRMGYLK
jgi:hypothetical protein